MNKRFKDDSEPIILTPDSAVHSHPHDSRHQARSDFMGPTPLSVEETVEVLGELDKLNAQVQQLTRELEAKDREIAQLQEQQGAASAENSERAVPEAGDSEAKDKEI